MKENVKKFLKDMIPVLLGVLIALWINNWNENRKNTEYITKIKSSINKELKETNDDIIKELSFQKTLIDTLNFYRTNDKVSIFDIMLKADGIHMPSIKINSWKAISRSKIELLEYEKISALASIEEQKEILESKTDLLINFLYPNIKETGSDKKELIILMMQDIIVTEKGIQKEIQALIID
jgi:site-specific recombinase XerD